MTRIHIVAAAAALFLSAAPAMAGEEHGGGFHGNGGYHGDDGRASARPRPHRIHQGDFMRGHLACDEIGPAGARLLAGLETAIRPTEAQKAPFEVMARAVMDAAGEAASECSSMHAAGHGGGDPRMRPGAPMRAHAGAMRGHAESMGRLLPAVVAMDSTMTKAQKNAAEKAVDRFLKESGGFGRHGCSATRGHGRHGAGHAGRHGRADGDGRRLHHGLEEGGWTRKHGGGEIPVPTPRPETR